MSGALIKGNTSDVTPAPAARPMYVAEVVRRPLPVERPVPAPPSLARTTTLIPPPLTSVGSCESGSGKPGPEEETLRISTLNGSRAKPAQVILIFCAMVMSLGAGALIRVVSRPTHRAPPMTMAPAREGGVVAAVPAIQSMPGAVVEVARRSEVTLINTQVLKGDVSEPELSQALRSSLATMQRCLEQHPQEAQALATDTRLRMRLGRSGRVRWVRASDLTPADGCFADSLRDTRFPRNASGLLADVTLRFSQ